MIIKAWTTIALGGLIRELNQVKYDKKMILESISPNFPLLWMEIHQDPLEISTIPFPLFLVVYFESYVWSPN